MSLPSILSLKFNSVAIPSKIPIGLLLLKSPAMILIGLTGTANLDTLPT